VRQLSNTFYDVMGELPQAETIRALFLLMQNGLWRHKLTYRDCKALA
ncbi:MAG: hypothetical protein ACI8XV_002842, partial [Arenicella sp.]